MKAKRPKILYTGRVLPFDEAELLIGIDECPTCWSRAQLYARNLNVAMVVQLASLLDVAKARPAYWVHVHSEVPRRDMRQFQLTKHWGFVESMPNDDSSKRTSGVWRPTAACVRFLRGEIDAAKTVFLYRDAVYGWSVERVRVGDIVEGFDYSKLMREGAAYLDSSAK